MDFRGAIVLTPLNPRQNPRFHPFTIDKVEKAPVEKLVIRDLKVVDNENLDVVLSQAAAWKQSWKQSRRIRFKMTPEPPGITEMDVLSADPQGKVRKESYTRLSDFSRLSRARLCCAQSVIVCIRA